MDEPEHGMSRQEVVLSYVGIGVLAALVLLVFYADPLRPLGDRADRSRSANGRRAPFAKPGCGLTHQRCRRPARWVRC